MFFFFFIAGPVSKLNSLLLTIRIPVTAHSCSQCTRYFIQSLLEIYSLALNLMVLPGARGRSWNLTKILLVYFEVGVGVSTLRQYSVVHAFIPRFQRHQIFHNHFVNLLFHSSFSASTPLLSRMWENVFRCSDSSFFASSCIVLLYLLAHLRNMFHDTLQEFIPR